MFPYDAPTSMTIELGRHRAVSEASTSGVMGIACDFSGTTVKTLLLKFAVHVGLCRLPSVNSCGNPEYPGNSSGSWKECEGKLVALGCVGSRREPVVAAKLVARSDPGDEVWAEDSWLSRIGIDLCRITIASGGMLSEREAPSAVDGEQQEPVR